MQIRPYRKTELARAYAPKLTDGSALNRLSRWLHRNETLYTALKEAGYSERQRIFSIRQVRIIFEHLGEP